MVVPAVVGEQPGTVAVTEYVPLAAVLALAMTGFCEVEENPLGPVHAYEAPEIVLAVSDKARPEQMVAGLPAVGVEGAGFTTTVVVPGAPGGHPLTVAVTEYVPDPAVEMPMITGF